VNQAELRLLAQERVLDAKALLDGQRWSFAYYTAGYAVECALKSCLLARMIHTGWVFQEKWKAQDCLTHDFKELIDLSGLRDELNASLANNPAFRNNWLIVEQWKVETRYVAKTDVEAKELYEAITHDPDGVVKWLQKYW
jgi:hypothetical protein